MKFFKKNKDDKLGWKIYFIIFLFGYFDMYILTGFSVNIDIKFFVHLILNILGVTAFFCFAWDKKFLNKLFWQIVFILDVVWEISSITLIFFALSAVSNNFYGLFSQITSFEIALIIIAVISHILFPLAGLYFYAFRSDVWKQ